MPGPSDELDLPADWTGGDSLTARPRKATSGKVKAVAVLMVMAIVGLSYLRFGPLLWHDEGGLPEADRSVPVFLDVKGDKTISGKNLTIKGDIVVREGGSLVISGCNITMNGTFRVNGSLAVRGSSIADFLAPLGFSSSRTLTILTNLTGCKWAWLNFTVEYSEKLARVLHATASAGEILSAELWGAGKEGPEKVTLDLSPFCGAVAEVDIDPGGSPASFNVIEPVITTDRFCTPTVDMIVKNEGAPYEVFDDPYPVWRPFKILMEWGNLDISNSTIASAGGYFTQIRANHTDVLVTDDRFAIDNSSGSQSVQFIRCTNCRLEVRSSTFSGGNGIRTQDSNVMVTDSLFENESTAIWGTDSSLSVDRCRFMGCYCGVSAETAASGTDSTVSIHDSDIDEKEKSSGSGIRLNNISASVEDSRILSPAPVVIVPPADIADGNASLADFVRISGNILQVCSTSYEQRAAVIIFSGVPVSGMDELVRQNRWNATMPAARYLIINEDEYDRDDYVYSFQYNMSGSAIEYDGSMQKEREYRLDEGWTECVARYDMLYSLMDFTWAVPMEKFETIPTGYCWTRQDPGALQFREERGSGTGTVDVDLGVLHRPLDILQLEIPIVPPPFDMGLYGLDAAYDWDMAAPVVSAGLKIAGIEPALVNVTIEFDGKTMDSWEMAPWSSPSELYALDMGTIASGQLSIIVSAPEEMETELSNNALTVPINVTNSSRTIEGETNISGIWCLRKGVNITFSNCSLAANGTGAFFFGTGDNRIEIIRSELNITSMRFCNVSGRINDSEIWGDSSGQFGSVDFVVEWGSWELDNVIFGSRRAEYERMEKEYREEPSGVLNRYYEDKLDWEPPYFFYLDIKTENLACHNISVYAEGCSMDANSTLIVARSRFLRCSPSMECWGNITLVDNAFSFMWHQTLAGNIVAQNNTFSDVFGSVTVNGMGSERILRGNEFIRHPFKYQWNSTGLVVGDGPLVLEGNLFTGLWAAVETDGPFTGMAALLQRNSFTDIGFVQALSRKSVKFQIGAQDYEALCLMFNRRITAIDLHWNDSLAARDSALRNFYFYSYIPSSSTSFCDWVVDAQGKETRLDAVFVSMVLVAPSGATWSTQMSIDIPAGDSLTVDIR
jgi:hypothetical protein